MVPPCLSTDWNDSLNQDSKPVPYQAGLQSRSRTSRSRLGLGFLRLIYIELQVQTEDCNYKILYSLQRYLGSLSISVENRQFCLFLNYELFNTIAIKNLNDMDVIKAWFALISALGTTNNVSKQKVHDYYRHSMLYLYYQNQFKFHNGQSRQTTEISRELQLIPHGTC